MDTVCYGGIRVKPNVDYGKAFALFIESGADSLREYMNSLNGDATEKLTMRDMKAWPDDILHSYLRKKSSSSDESDIAILRGNQFQGRLIYNQDGSFRDTDQIRELVETELDSKFPALDNIRAKKRAVLIDKLMILSAPKESGKASAIMGSKSQVIEAASKDADLEKIVGLFIENRDRRKLTPKKLFEDYYNTIREDKTPNYRKWATYAQKNYKLTFTSADLKEAIDLLRNEIPPEFKRPTQPLLEELIQLHDTKSAKQGRYQISTLSASDIIGRLDTKKAEKRNDIYKYWKGKHSEFAEFTKAHNAFVAAIVDLDLSQHKELKRKIDEFSEIEVDELNYIKLYNPVEINDIDKIEDKALILLEEFLKNQSELPEEKIMYTQKVPGVNDSSDVTDYTASEADTEPVKDDLEEEILDTLTDITVRKVDPLYAYILEETDALPAGAVVEDQLDDIEDALKTGLIIVEVEDLLPALEKFLAHLKKSKAGKLKEYYLPAMTKMMPRGKDPNPAIAEYLKMFAQFIEYGEKNELQSKGGTTGLKPKGGQKRTVIGRSGVNAKTHMNDFKDLGITEKFQLLLESIVKFFIEPSRNQNRPFDDELPFIEQTGSRPIERIAQQPQTGESPFIHLLRMEGADWKLNKEQLKQIADFMKTITGINVGSAQNELLNKTENLGDLLNDIFAGELEEMIEIELGNFLHGVFRDANLPDMKFGLGTKQSVAELSGKYKKNEIYPFEALFNHIYLKKESYTDKDSGVDGAEEYIRQIQTAERELDIIKSQEQKLILQAHDEIRKMLGKPIYYGMASIDNYDAVNSAISYMSETYNTDITAMDVENVVNELDSMNNISVKYGVPEEGVYFLKANFR